MRVTPKSESQLQEANLLPPGEYPFTVLESNEIASKSANNPGKMMFALKLCVHGDTDKHVYDYFADWFSEYKLRHFCETVGLLDSYMEGIVDATDGALSGRTGYVKIGIEEGKGNYGPKNVVKDYITKEQAAAEASAPKSSKSAEPPIDDDVPF